MGEPRLGEAVIEILRYLRAEVGADRGWSLFDVRGWRFANEFPDSLKLVDSRIQTLVRHGMVDRADVRDPFQRRPLYLYRISASGLEALAAHEARGGATPAGKTPVTLPPQAESRNLLQSETIFLSAAQWRGLLYLQQQPSGLLFTPASIGRAIERGFYANDGDLLVRRMLAACVVPAHGPRRYGVAPLGLLARAIDEDTSGYLVMVHVPGIREAASSGDEAEAMEIVAEVVCADLPEEDHASATAEVFSAIADVYTRRGRSEPDWLQRARAGLRPADTVNLLSAVDTSYEQAGTYPPEWVDAVRVRNAV